MDFRLGPKVSFYTVIVSVLLCFIHVQILERLRRLNSPVVDYANESIIGLWNVITALSKLASSLW